MTRRLRIGLALALAAALLAAARAAAGIWAPVDSGLGPGATDTIRAIDYQCAERFWFVTDTGKFRYREGGVFKEPAPAQVVGATFNDVAFDAGATGIAVGNAGHIWRSTDGGRTWTRVNFSTVPGCRFTADTVTPTVNPDQNLYTVKWGAGARVYIGGEFDTVLRSNDGGASFTEIRRAGRHQPHVRCAAGSTRTLTTSSSRQHLRRLRTTHALCTSSLKTTGSISPPTASRARRARAADWGAARSAWSSIPRAGTVTGGSAAPAGVFSIHRTARASRSPRSRATRTRSLGRWATWRAQDHRRRWFRYRRAGRFAVASRAGANSRAFSGRIGRTRLAPGTHRMTLVATDAARNRSKTKALIFRIVRR